MNLSDLILKYEIIANIIHDVRNNEYIEDEPVLIHVSIVYEYLHLVMVDLSMKSLTVIFPIEDLFDLYSAVRKKLISELENLKDNPIIITDQIELVAIK